MEIEIKYNELLKRAYKARTTVCSNEELTELVSDLETALIDARCEICESCFGRCNPECWLYGEVEK